MTRIDPPSWAPEYAKHIITSEGPYGEHAKMLAYPWLSDIFAELDRRVNHFANDPEQCFTSEADGFPLRDRLVGTYYIGSETYKGDVDVSQPSYSLWIFVRCLETYWHPNQERFGYDYLGLEAIVNLRPEGDGYDFQEGFNASVI